MQPELGPRPPRLDANQSDAFIADERMKHPDGIAASTYAREDRVREPMLALQDLPAGLFADYSMEIANHHGIWMRTQRRAKQIVRGLNIRYPIAHRFAYRILQCSAASCDAHNFRAQQTHAEDVEPLAAHVLLTHVDNAFQPK